MAKLRTSYCPLRCIVRAGAAIAVVGSVTAVSGSARASMAYGYTLLSAGYIDGCAACHDDNARQGGLGTANKPFAKTMKGLGLTGNGDDTFFREILDTQLQDYDTDCDGVIDLDELTKNGNVNDPEKVPTGYTPMFTLGCNDADTTGTDTGESSMPASTAPGGGDTSREFDDSRDSSSNSGCTVAAKPYGGGAAVLGVVAIGLLGLCRRLQQS